MNERESMLRNDKITSLLVKLSLPATIGMMVNALYNLVDTIFVGQGVGAAAIGALTISFPIQMFLMALAQMIGIGAASVISRSLGSKDYDKVYYTTGNAFILITVISVFTVGFGLSFIDPLLRLFGATETLLPLARDYMQIILLGSLFFNFTVMSNNLVRAEGAAKVSMFTMIIGTGLNIVLDPIFIFGFDMGIKGAALATILSQFVSFAFIVSYLLGKKTSIKVKLDHLSIKPKIIREMITVGFPAFARQAAGSIVSIVLNNSLGYYGGDFAISVFGIINRVMMFLFMPLFGVVQGMQPITGYNYGAKQYDRVKDVVFKSILASTAMATFSWLILQLFPDLIVSVFTKEAEIISAGKDALRIVLLATPIIGIQIIASSYYQAIGKATPSLILTLLRQVIMLIPLVYLLPKMGLGLFGIWIAFPISDFASTLLSYVFLRKEIKFLNKEHKQITASTVTSEV